LVLKNDNSASAIPPSLLNLVSNTANYMIWGGETLTVPGGQEGTVLMQLEYPTPEPASWLVFVATLGGVAIRYRGRRQRR